METSIYFSEIELEKKWDTDPIGVYNAIEDGLPAYLGNTRVSHHQLKFKLNDPDFEKWMRRLRFWKRHVELFEFGGAEAVFEGTRLRYPSMGDSPTFEMPVAPPLPVNKKERKPRYHKEKKKFVELYKRFLKDDPGKPFTWFYEHRILSKDLRKEHKLCKPNTDRPFPKKTLYKWKKLYEKGELL